MKYFYSQVLRTEWSVLAQGYYSKEILSNLMKQIAFSIYKHKIYFEVFKLVFNFDSTCIGLPLS